MRLYQSTYRVSPKLEAQAHLSGRTHYVDDSTLSYFHARILVVRRHYGGRLLSIIESCAANYANSARIVRPVVFDICGSVVYRPDIEGSPKTRPAAEKMLFAWLDTIGADGAARITADALGSHARHLERDAQASRELAAKVNAGAENARDCY